MKIQSKSIHKISPADEIFVASIENFTMQLVEFNHVAHLKLAYCYLVKNGLKNGIKKMSQTLKSFLAAKGVDGDKFHVTLTHVWVNLVWQAMLNNPGNESTEIFLSHSPMLLNKDIVFNYYSHDLLFSEQARNTYVYPDLSAFT